MKMINSKKLSVRKCLFLLLAGLAAFAVLPVNAQKKVVGLDNWYNHETNPKTGKPYHYLWTDSAFSGYSRWGQIFTKKGAKITTLTAAPDAASLNKLDIYIIVDPDTLSENPSPNYIMPNQADAIQKWVRDKGGVLVLLANDAPNCEFTHLNQLSKRFGIIFNYVSIHQVLKDKWEMGAVKNLPVHPIFKDVKKIYLKEISTFTLSKPAQSVLTENGQILMAVSKYGKGMVFAVGDPWIYNEYIDHDRLPKDFDNRKAAENLTTFLLQSCHKGQAKK
ncbi:MAG: hypothetical protein Q8907_16470 [Bacteroidota bacterium]|nr:hypothetical protein [Bacteroidota bacterium]MDP4275864.1 hypothetical protein [Bacteroidota bacterium]